MIKVSVAVPVYNVENYIYDMLKSVQQQTFVDYEVIIIDDGSTDRSSEIARQFCDKDKRFRYFRQENAGVAAARNKAIELAQGKYIVFYDPDDFIPGHALEKMYAAISSQAADMVVGVMEEKNLGESLIYMHSQKLAKQKHIDPWDEHFIGAWSLCHKMFSVSLLRENDIRFEKLYNAEDGVFTYAVLNCANRICGCDTIAYNYMKRPFWLTPSATQTISRKYFESLLLSHDRIFAGANSLISKYLDEDKSKQYIGKLCYRFIEGEMINGYYRGIWRSEDDLTKTIAQRTTFYRRYLTDKQWKKLIWDHRDLELERGYMSAEEMADEPIVSVIINTNETARRTDMMLGSLYNQSFPRFEVIIPCRLADIISPVYREKANLRVVDNDDFLENSIEISKGKFIAIFDRFAIYTKNSLRYMTLCLMSDSETDMASIMMKNYDGNIYSPINIMNAIFGYVVKGRRGYTRLTAFDNILSNKLFRKEKLRELCIKNSQTFDIVNLYRHTVSCRLRKSPMITDMKDEDFIDIAGESPPLAEIKIYAGLHSFAARQIARLKRHITKEDVEKLKRKIRR